MECKKISGKKYWLFGKYYEEAEAYGKAMEIKRRYEKEKTKGRFRYFIEEIKSLGDADELFLPGTKYFLWVNKL